MSVLLQCSFADVRFGSKASVVTASSLMSGFVGKAASRKSRLNHAYTQIILLATTGRDFRLGQGKGVRFI